MKKLFILSVFFACNLSFSQGANQPSDNAGDNSVYNTAGIEVKPNFPGGMEQFYKYIGSSYNVPTSKDFPGGKVYVSFVIEKDGSVTEVKILRDAGFGTGEEAVRVLKRSPKWTPGEQNGKKVRVLYSLPISLPSYIYSVKEVDVAPNYQGGFDKLSDLIYQDYNAPKPKEFKGGNVLIEFTVEVDGSLSDLTVFKDLGFGTGDEAIRVLKSLKNWIPAQKNGKNVRCSYGIPIILKSN